MNISPEQLKKIFPNVRDDKAKRYSEAFNRVMPRYNMDAKRLAAFLGQIGVESGELRFDKELPSKWNKRNISDPNEPVGSLYEGRRNLGNDQIGDGPKFIGRGVLQITGRANYTLYSRKVGFDLLANPELACNPEIATRIACEYFQDRGLFELADKWDLEEITRRVNGNQKLHLKERIQYSEKALAVLNSSAA